MLIVESICVLRFVIKHWHRKNQNVALVPTMGSIHEGHLSLVAAARKHADIVIVSIFINPMQFDKNEDFYIYPRSLEEDYIKLKKNNVDLVFSPSISSIYPEGISNHTYVEVPKYSRILEGVNRPKHFRGVTTLISKLFNFIKPNIAYFGEKDFQQVFIVKKLVVDMGYDINIISVPTLRTKDGLALSSRNKYLTTEEKKLAIMLNKTINIMATQLKERKWCIEKIISEGEILLKKCGFKIDILTICHPISLDILKEHDDCAVIIAAAWLGKTRLIDNKTLYL
ncbi:pantoate--beta-alanine ligase [Candidatus Ishikawella capsulata]|uniref:Pantothenate synthetase n=1 Tax=Candidatus Ishikawaella capsulata Mpkobe TaxID=476281 RepID=C5WCL7_9ENTR|nr:pantoate--beta-alanine ligase [Candidatus Ishikawaella capsulata]BAH83073.1 pantoate-beta-alanine ligase [Candidatus Ishikawaella capsulata Mpkobe]